ncbi:Putative F-box/LRR-repeat protein At3g18150 [Linum grandiflorum]
MTNNKNNRKKSNRRVDRISNLPDSILHHIVSFLDFRSAVKTCLLSKQWECVWKHVHALNLQPSFREYSQYETFVDKLLSLRYPLQVSKLFWNMRIYGWQPKEKENPIDDCKFSLLRKVVRYAVSHGAQHFDLKPIYNDKSKIPLFELFDSTSDSVITLELVRFDIYCQPERSPPRFRFLTTLKLKSCCFSADEDQLAHEPFSQFPSLKDLVLLRCELVAKRDWRLRVSGLELVNLRISDIKAHKLEIFAPKLKSLILDTNPRIEFSKLTLPSLVHAEIQSSRYHWRYFNDDYNKKTLLFMFHSLHNVESLRLCQYTSKVFHRISKFIEQQPSPFKKLNKLNLEFLSRDEIPYKVLDNYFFHGSSDAGLNISIRKEGIWRWKGFWQVMIERLPLM